MRSRNLCIISGIIASEFRVVKTEAGLLEASFAIEQNQTLHDGRVIVNTHLCKLIGDRVQELSKLAIGLRVSLEGTIRKIPESSRCFIETFTIHVDRPSI